MTGTSLTTQGNVAHLRGGKPPIIPTSVKDALHDGYDGWNSTKALARLKAEGFDNQVSYLAEHHAAACRPIEREKLVKRLTALGMVMAPNRPAAEATMWVHEMTRLLRDLPEDLVCEAIDHLQKTCKFLPTVAEIRELADPALEARRRDVARLDAMARLIASGAVIPELRKREEPEPKAAEPPCTPEQAAAIVAEFGLAVDPLERIARHSGPPRMPTRADYIALGVDPSAFASNRSE